MTDIKLPAETVPKQTRAIIITIALVVGTLPLVIYWLSCGRVPMVTPRQAKALLLAEHSQAVLVDMRSTAEFASCHIDGAVNWPLEGIEAADVRGQVPGEFQGKTLLFISEGGLAGSLATGHLIKSGLDARNVRGGIQEWIGSTQGQEGGLFERFRSETGKIWQFPFRVSPWHEQFVAVVSGFVIKPTYSVLALLLAIVLWRRRSPDLTALRWSMICFFIGENFCAANYVFFTDRSYLSEYLHSLGMLLSFGFAAYAIFEGIDTRILMLSDPGRKCAAQHLCRECAKYEDVPCGLRRAFFLIIPALAIIAMMPLFAGWCSTSYNTSIFGTFYHYIRRLVYQHFEMQYCPVAAIVLLAVSFLVLAFKKNNSLPLAKVFFAAGMGPLGFGLFRCILTSMYGANLVWFAFWEEANELIFILGVCYILWLFRHSLFKTENSSTLQGSTTI